MAREMSSPGKDVAQGVAEALGLEVVHQEIIDQTADRMRLRKRHVVARSSTWRAPSRQIFNPATPTYLTENLSGFERLLAHNPSAKIIWAHAGSDPLQTRVPTLERTLLSTYPNLYMSVRIGVGNPQPGEIFGAQPVIKPEWLALLQDFPDRFVLGSDYFYAPTNMREQTEQDLQRIGQLLDQLPIDLAKKIAYQNAELLFRLNLRL